MKYVLAVVAAIVVGTAIGNSVDPRTMRIDELKQHAATMQHPNQYADEVERRATSKE